MPICRQRHASIQWLLAAVHMGVPIALGSHQEFTFTLSRRVGEGGNSGLMQLDEKVGDFRKGQDYVASTSSLGVG